MTLAQGTLLLPKAERLFEIICGLTWLLTERRVSQRHFATFFGVLQWVMLANRPLLASCTHVYKLVDADSREPEDTPRRVPYELGLITTLAFGMVVDLRAGWAPFVWATDGAQDYRYGGASAKCHPDVTRVC